MNLQYLHSFYITVKFNSISKAAKILFLTQPGLSMQLQALEKELGCQLLIRSNKGVELTKEGEVVFNYADKILALKDNIERDLDAVKCEREYLLISSCRTLGEYALPCTLYLYKTNYPNVDIDLQVCSSTEVTQHLLNHSSNIGIVQNISSHPNLIFHHFYDSDIVLVGSSDQLLEAITKDVLLTLPLILPAEGSGCRQAISECLSNYGIQLSDLNIVFEANSMEAIKSAISTGKGYSFFPSFSIKKELKHNILRPVSIEDITFVSTYSFCYRKDYKLQPFEVEFIQLLSSSARGFC
ncbi:MAG: LysR substrate-binding domain-containing protein [Cellulosilyticaceae bacterium]